MGAAAASSADDVAGITAARLNPRAAFTPPLTEAADADQAPRYTRSLVHREAKFKSAPFPNAEAGWAGARRLLLEGNRFALLEVARVRDLERLARVGPDELLDAIADMRRRAAARALRDTWPNEPLGDSERAA